MNMVIPNEGKLRLLDWMIRDAGGAFPGMVLNLFQNDYTPINTSTVSDFDPSTFTGYLPIPIARADMGAPALVGNVAYSTCAFIPTFTCTGGSPEDAYGWYLTSDDDDTVLAAQRFDAVRSMVGGAAELISPFKIGLQTLH